LSEEHLYQFTITSPAGESRKYNYQFTERSYSWLPFFVFQFIVPGWYVDPFARMDTYANERTSIFEEKIIPRLMTDAGPFLLSKMTKTAK